MKNKHGGDDKEKTLDYKMFEKLYEGLFSFNVILNKFTEKGIKPEKRFTKHLEFGTKLDKNSNNPNLGQTKENIEDISTRIERAKDILDKWEDTKNTFLDDPTNLRNYISLQMIGKSLIKMNKNNFEFYIKFFEKDLKIKSKEKIELITDKLETDERFNLIYEFFNEYKTQISEIINKKTIKERKLLKYLKYVELPFKDAYNYILSKFRTTLKEEYTSDQILFCSWHTKWSQVESK
jgi:hypothetical protein